MPKDRAVADMSEPTMNGAVAALGFLKGAQRRLTFLQQSLWKLDNGDGVLEGAASVADDARLAVFEAEQALRNFQAKQGFMQS